MLKRLKLHRFRYVTPGTELTFTEHFNVLLGRNGTGKTTLLDLISMVLRSDFSPLRNEEFDIEYEFSHEHGTGLVRIDNKQLAQPVAHTPRTPRPHGSERPRKYQPHMNIKLHLDRVDKDHEVEIEVEGATTRWRKSGSTWEEGAVVDVFESWLLERIAYAISSTDRTALEAHVILWGFNQAGWWAYRFDESLGIFESLTAVDAGRMPEPGRAPAISLEIRFNSEAGSPPRMGALRQLFFPLQYEPAHPEPGQSSTNVRLRPSSSLAKFPELAGIKGMSMSLAVEGSQQEPDGLWWELGRAEFLFSGEGGAVFNHNALSYGQKRLLAFLYYLDANFKFVVADELVNGMHHDWIRACLDEIGDRQSFLTSQNPLLLDYLPLESVEQIQKSFIQCRAEVVDDRTQLVWSNLAEDDAEELFADYKVGIQHVGEILRTRGLW